jgi:hypothetical protein
MNLSPEGRLTMLAILASAVFRETKIIIDGEAITLDPGQLICSRKKLALVADVSEQNVRTAISKLELLGFLTKGLTKGNHTIITVNNWNIYSGYTNDNQNINQGSTKVQPRSNQIEESIIIIQEEKPIQEEEIKNKKKERHIVHQDSESPSGLDKTATAIKCLIDNFDKYQKLYPEVDFDKEKTDFQRWADMSPSKVNAKSNWNMFWHKWLKRANERAAYKKSKQPYNEIEDIPIVN